MDFPSDSISSSRYKKPTDELRVVTRVLPVADLLSECFGPGERGRTVVIKVQRKWWVGDDKRVRLEWRDIPVVTEEQVRAEGLTTPPQEG